MAGTSPRRSSRARTSLPPNSEAHHSSTSSNSSSRPERSTRTAHKTESPRKPAPSASLSSDASDEAIAMAEDRSTRRGTRGRTQEQERSTKDDNNDLTGGDDEIVEDDEAVRCICGFDEYPGPPPIEDENKKGIKDSSEVDFITEADYTEDLAGFFLQCDSCKVWQHGGCVGIKNEDMSPDEYFCELCRKDLHRVFTAPNGQKYSYYLPLHQTMSRTTSRAASFSKDGTRSPKGSRSGRPSSSLQSAKRRSTMNSRDAAYDEEEQLRRAIEASKGENGESIDGGSRRAKRGRSDSEEIHEGLKRQRTQSNSPSPGEAPRFANDSEENDNGRNSASKRARGAPTRSTTNTKEREKELREERERLRAEAANKRKGRADRRRVDESDANDSEPPTLKPSKSMPDLPAENTQQQTYIPPPASQPPTTEASPAPPATTQSLSAPGSSHKKGAGRPAATLGKRGKGGKNQYTKDRDGDGHGDAAAGGDSPEGRSVSRDVVAKDSEGENQNNPIGGKGAAGGGKGATNGNGNGENGHGHGHGHGHAEGRTEGRQSNKARGRGHGGAGVGAGGHGGGVSRVTFTDMKRKVAAMLDFITRTQLEIAGDLNLAQLTSSASGAAGGTPSSDPTRDAVRGLVQGMAKEMEMGGASPVDEEVGDGGQGGAEKGGEEQKEKEFEKMTTLEMMDWLARRCVKWQNQFA